MTAEPGPGYQAPSLATRAPRGTPHHASKARKWSMRRLSWSIGAAAQALDPPALAVGAIASQS